MLYKTQIVHLSSMSPRTIEEAEWVVEIVRAVTLYCIQGHIDVDDPDSFRFYYNRRPVDEQQPSIHVHVGDNSEQEVAMLNNVISKHVLDAIEAFEYNYLARPVNRSILNIEAALINSENLVLSFEVY